MKNSTHLYSVDQIETLYQASNQVYGIAKRFQVERQPLSIDKMKGDSGEQAVAGLLNLWAANKAAQVFHSLGTHDGNPGETDHVVIHGGTILIVETKTFTGYETINITKHGTVYGSKDGREHKLFDNKLARKVELYQRRFPDFTVKGLLVVAGYGTIFTSDHSSYFACGLDRFNTVLDENANEGKMVKTSHKSAVIFFGSLCLKNM